MTSDLLGGRGGEVVKNQSKLVKKLLCAIGSRARDIILYIFDAHRGGALQHLFMGGKFLLC